jgi:aryl-alcohol dehydrogenase-like predicted oxidoreductase/predicted kinase
MIGLGCMRVTDPATIAAALDAGITLFDTARAYDGNEELLAQTLRGTEARIATKGGMAPGWIPDGRAKSIRADCEASLAALAGLPIDLYLLHAPDPRVPWATSIRALARLVDDGLVRAVGVCNVNRAQLDEALELAPLAAVENALSAFDDRAVRGGVVARCEERGLMFLAHSPLGGPKRAERVADPERALAEVLAVSSCVVAIPGATRPETVRSAARAASLHVERPRARRVVRGGGEVVLVMGIPGAGKGRIAQELVEQGYVRLNRDERGGTLRELAAELDGALESGARHVVLDNTYLSRASRNLVVETAARHGASARCLWLDTPLAQAQVNLAARVLDHFGRLPSPAELKQSRIQGILAPTSQLRAVRELEPPSDDEGFVQVERVAFVREPGTGTAGTLVAASCWPVETEGPTLVFDWRPDGTTLKLDGVEAAVCPHGGGPPVCWCRPPLPGLVLAFARTSGVDPARSTLVGTSAAHRSLAAAVGARFVRPQP